MLRSPASGSMVCPRPWVSSSSWFANFRADDGDDPYWLYALSNGGSLLALLAIAAARATPAIAHRAKALAATMDTVAAPARPIDAARRFRWILLAAIPSGLLLLVAIPSGLLLLVAIPSGLLMAVTTFIATDLVSAPLLWVWPLAIYLGSFIVAFSPRGRRFIPPAVVTAPAMITLLWVPFGSAGGWPVLATLLLELLALGIRGRMLPYLVIAGTLGSRAVVGELVGRLPAQSIGDPVLSSAS